MSMDVNSPEAALWSENMRLKSENEHLRAALKPFADAVIPKGPDRYTLAVDAGDIEMSDLIHAHTAYQQSTAGKSDA